MIKPLHTNRVGWIDSAKAIGILFVILGHHHKHPLYDYIYTFHMPLFFFISGMMFYAKPDNTWLNFTKRKAQTLLIPYFIFSFGLFLVWWLLGRYIDPGILRGYSLSKNFIGIFYAQGQMEYMRWGLEMWFLPCLFLTSISFFFIRNLSIIQQGIVIVICAFVGFLLPNVLPFRLPWSVDIALVSIGFFWLGCLSKEIIQNVKLSFGTVIVIILLLATNLATHHLQGLRIDMYQAIYGNIPLFYLSAISGVLFYVLLARCVPAFSVLTFVGMNSLIIYMLHMRGLTVINFILNRVPNVQIDESSLLGALLLSLLQILILVPAVLIINRFFPFLLGRTRASHS